ncbi:hypothetical protein [Halobacterium salinarum]|uniref:hypothetical protein n=1 Tax=Halobacterium salinarum TaxID=2242 RepID=UPI0025572ADA|nr:hypothetical protein [Halobacterium salinarum]
MDMIRFLLLDGCAIRAGSSHPTIRVYSSDRAFLEAAREILGWAANDVHTHRTAEATARQMRENFGADVSTEDCSATYGLATRPLPELDGFEGPTDVEQLSPRLLKWMIARSGRYVGIPIFPNVHLDVRDMDATEGHVRRLLASHGVQTGRQTDSSMFIPTRHDGVVAIPSEGVQQIKNRFGIEITPESDDRAHVVPEEAEGDFPEPESV